MSRNLEILEQLQQERDLFRVAPVAARTTAGERPSAVNGSVFHAEEFGHEELLRLAQRLFLGVDGRANGAPRQVVFCGVDAADGSSVLCAQLGRILASQVTSQVCVVDANVRAPTLERLLGVERTNGQNLPSGASQHRFLQQLANNLWLVSGHPASANGGVTASLDEVRVQIQNLPAEFAHVVISAPPVGFYNDAVLLGQRAEGVVLVLEANSTRRVAARKAKEALEATHVRVLGTVLNNRTFAIPEKIYRRL